MSLTTIRKRTAVALAVALKTEFDHTADDIVLEIPPNRELGDLAWPGALPLARIFRTSPRAIAETLAEKTSWPIEIERVEVAGPGFLNLFLDRRLILARLLEGRDETPADDEKTIIEHTNINPNKAAHIGHLRNAVLGDTLVRCCRRLGSEVEVQNYIDDTGVQVADVVVGVLYLPEDELSAALGIETERRTRLLGRIVDAVSAVETPTSSTTDFDDLCWEIYPRVTSRYPEDEIFAGRRAEVLHAVEAGFGDLGLDEALNILKDSIDSSRDFPAPAIARLATAVASANVRCHLATMARLGVSYNVLPHESDILHLGFWTRAFDLLKEAGAIRLETDGKNAGCWVMSLADSPEFADMDDPDKILVRSNGTVTYTGKDIAYQLWKLGLLTDPDGSLHDFGYSEFARWTQSGPAAPVQYGTEGRVLARTRSDRSIQINDRSFGGGSRVYNVIDVRQSYPQKVVKEAVRILGHPEAADRSIHFAYEMVALTPAAVEEIERRSGRSFGLSDEQKAKSYVEMSGRKGIGVKADEFLDILEAAAADAVRNRAAGDAAPDDLDRRARAIAVGALRYLMARQSRNRVLAFDFDEALAFEGDTGPYLQYSAVRAAKIFEKLRNRRGEGAFDASELPALGDVEIPDDLWGLVLECARRREVIRQAVETLEFSLLAGHVHNLAQLFHKLYHGHPVIPEDDESLRRLRRAVFTLFAREMHVLLEELLGIPIPKEM